MVLTALELEDDHDVQGEDDDSRDQKDDREEKDSSEDFKLDLEYLGIALNVHFLQGNGNTWHLLSNRHVDHPVIDVLIPPPKTTC